MQARQHWPSLTPESFVETSPVDHFYNCAAHAADDNDKPWWPSLARGYYWPPDVPRTANLASFEAAYATKGYERCENPDLEEEVEKIAVYALDGVPKHVARQLASGRWTSKLGDLKDIDHATLDDLAGPGYGHPVLFMRRPRAQEDARQATGIR